THLTGVYDAAEKVVKLYRNGVLVDNQPRTATPWATTGKVHIGWAKYGVSGTMATGVGNIGEVRLWNRAVTVDDLNGTVANAANGVPAQPGILSPMQVGSWDFSGGADCFCDNVLDGSFFGRPMTLD